MATAMLITAILQLLITVYALASGAITEEPMATILGANLFFILLWIGAATLFRKAASQMEPVTQ